jgi:hypothetical protein
MGLFDKIAPHAGNIFLAMLQNRWNKQRATTQYNREIEMMRQQLANQQLLNKQGQELQMKTWLDTNYPSQIEMLKSAGMNPSLLYGKGGSGGVTGSASGGHAAMGQAVQAAPAHIPYIDAIQIQKVQSEIELNKSIALKNKAETGYATAQTAESTAKLGEITANIQNKEAQTELFKIDEQLKKLDYQVANETTDEKIKKAEIEVKSANEQLTKLTTETKITTETYRESIQIIQQRALESVLNNIFIRSETDKNRQLIEQSKAQIIAQTQELYLRSLEIDTESYKTEIEAWSKEMQVEYPNIWNVLGGSIVDVIAQMRGWVGNSGKISGPHLTPYKDFTAQREAKEQFKKK